jgi:hypothetical protein
LLFVSFVGFFVCLFASSLFLLFSVVIR